MTEKARTREEDLELCEDHVRRYWCGNRPKHQLELAVRLRLELVEDGVPYGHIKMKDLRSLVDEHLRLSQGNNTYIVDSTVLFALSFQSELLRQSG